MIKLEVADYCQECPDFEVIDEIQERFEDGYGYSIRHSIQCKYERRCESIYRFLKQNLIKNKQ